MTRDRLCFLVRHLTMAPLAIVLALALAAAADRIAGMPQEITSSRALDAQARAGGWVRMSYTSVKHRDCPIELRRWLYRLNALGARVPGGRRELTQGPNAGTHGLAGPGEETLTIRLWIPFDLAPGLYEYEAEIHRRCTPLVGRRWRIATAPARFEVLTPAG